jgi:hypothetical protein
VPRRILRISFLLRFFLYFGCQAVANSESVQELDFPRKNKNYLPAMYLTNSTLNLLHTKWLVVISQAESCSSSYLQSRNTIYRKSKSGRTLAVICRCRWIAMYDNDGRSGTWDPYRTSRLSSFFGLAARFKVGICLMVWYLCE